MPLYNLSPVSMTLSPFSLSFSLSQYSLAGVNSLDGAEMTPLMWTAFHQNPTVLRHLLALGADVEEKDVEGKTAMHW